ncbi:MAG: hypothetical protein AAGC96_13485 [Pseudomonadota bacterium]
MAQGSKPRHSRTTRKPVTIDLEPEAVSEPEKEGSGGKTTAKSQTSGKTAAASTAKSADSASKAADAKTDDKAEPAKTDKTETSSAATATGPKTKAVPDSGSVKKAGTAGNDAGDVGKKPSKQTTESTPPPPNSQGGGGVRTIGAGLAGAVIAILALFGLQWGGVIPTPGNADTASGIISADIDALKQAVASLEGTAGSDTSGLTAALQERVEALEQTADLSASGAGSTLTALETRLGELTTKVEGLAGNGASDLSDRVTSLQSAHSSQQTSLAQLQSTVSGLSNTITADEAKQAETLKALDERLASIEKSMSAPREDIRVARALAAANLKAAIDRGGSFMAELEAFASVDGDSDAIGQLRTLAASGVPSRSALLNEFPAVANDMINAAGGSTEETGWVGRLVDSASSLVQVRPVGEISGDSVEAIVARMENKLSNGDLQGAVDEWKTLPEASQKASEAYEKDLEARILVEKLVAGSVNEALPTETTTGGAAQTQSNGSTSQSQQTGGTN